MRHLSVLCCSFCLLASVPPSVAEEEPQAALQRALTLIEAAEVNLSSCRVRCRVHNEIPLGTRHSVQDVELSEVMSGRKRRHEASTKEKGRTDDVGTNTFDGDKYMAHWPAAQLGTTGSDGSLQPGYYSYLYGDNRPLWSKLKPIRDVLRAKWEPRDGRRLLQVVWGEPAKGLGTLWLDPEIDFQPREYRMEYHVTGPGPTIDSFTATRYLDYSQSAGFWFPSRVSRVFEQVKDGHKEIGSMRMELTAVEANVPVAASEFELEFPAGTEVQDTDRRISYRVAPDGKWKKLEKERRAADSARADFFDLRSWWVAAALLAAMAGGVWWRQRAAH